MLCCGEGSITGDGAALCPAACAGRGCWQVCRVLSVAGEREQVGLNRALQVGAAALGRAVLCKVSHGN